MRTRPFPVAALLVACTLSAVFTHAAFAALPVIKGEPALRTKSAPAAQEQMMSFSSLPESSPALLKMLPFTPATIQRSALNSVGKHLQIGLPREIAAEAYSPQTFRPEWLSLSNGAQVARFGVKAHGARALRAGLALGNLPAGAVLRVQGPQDAGRGALSVSGEFINAAQNAAGLFWTPITDGDVQEIELQVPAGTPTQLLSIRIETISHLLVAARDQFAEPSTKSGGPGSAAACHEDIACVSSPSEAFVNAARSVAKMVYTKNGSTYVCTGTLVNDNDGASQVPYLLTAAHCINSQTVAGTLNTFWFFEASLCKSKSTAAYKQLAGGATLLHANASTDVALLRLKERAPDGAYFSGWNPNPLSANAPVVTLHHPAGDLKKVSSGMSLDPAAAGLTTNLQQAVTWLSGSTEGGSSGSALFSLQSGEYVLRGALSGGSASCSSTGNTANPANRDYFARLDHDYPRLKEILASGVGPMDDYTDMWGTQGENGWGLSIVQHGNNKLFAVWFTYDADGSPLWLVMPGGEWKSVSDYEGPLYRGTGPAYTKSFDEKQVNLQPVGTASLRFAASGAGTWTATVNGVTQTKNIQRFAY